MTCRQLLVKNLPGEVETLLGRVSRNALEVKTPSEKCGRTQQSEEK
jgi:hypothetical protein